MSRQPNRLIHEKSPYLRQHAHNPVDWYPWGDEALARAREERKLIFLSIGYSTCHWCHVMEKESFEDAEVARLLNENFVSIKLDREERPDLDHYFMGVCQMLTGSGGWPLTVVLTPDRKPFFAGTYFPRARRYGRPGMLELLPYLKSLWTGRPEEVLKTTEAILKALEGTAAGRQKSELDPETPEIAYDQLEASFDEVAGGFGSAPKFPAPHNLLFLLQHWKRRGKPKALRMVEKTLLEMRLGGITDHLGFGFHRYSTDPGWLVPHFEKMLYDQALLAMVYTEAFQATGDDFYGQAAREIITYVRRDMTSDEGGFYSAEDADSEGEEGKFYVWTESELRSVLSREEADFAVKIFSVDPRGNFEEGIASKDGKNILHLVEIPAPEIRICIGQIREKLFAAREKRPRPLKDTKILTDWNGLMIAAMARAAQVLGEKACAETAVRAADFILRTMGAPEKGLFHLSIEGETKIDAFLDDYAFFIWGLIELYEAVLDVRFLEAALGFTDHVLGHFRDEKNGGFFFVSDKADDLPIRPKEIYDGAYPSGNSVMMRNLLRLGRMTGDQRLEEIAFETPRAFSEAISRSPSAHCHLLCALDFAAGPPQEIAIVGNLDSHDTRGLLLALRGLYLPNSVVLFKPDSAESRGIEKLAPFLKALTAVDGKATAYVCSNYRCALPTSNPQQLIDLLTRET